jgi:hypothetical protein
MMEAHGSTVGGVVVGINGRLGVGIVCRGKYSERTEKWILTDVREATIEVT